MKNDELISLYEKVNESRKAFVNDSELTNAVFYNTASNFKNFKYSSQWVSYWKERGVILTGHSTQGRPCWGILSKNENGKTVITYLSYGKVVTNTTCMEKPSWDGAIKNFMN